MKTLNYILSILILAGSFWACSDDDHYSQKDPVINNDNVEIVDMPIIEYLESHASYSSMNTLFKETGIFNRMTTENLLYTVFIVPDELAPDLPTVSKADEEEKDDDATYLAKGHISTVSLSPSNMRDNQRLVMWNGKYVSIAKMEAEDDHDEVISVNSSRVKRVIKTTNGFIYELEALINTPKNLLEIIEDLSDEYSIFKEMILSKNEKTFDKDASVPNGVDASGNTTYDSVFVTTNPYFLHKGVDLSSEAASFTMLIPSDKLINDALSEAKSKLQSWNMVRPDSILENWCFQVAFFNKKYTRETFEDPENIDLTSVFSKQWRTTINTVDLDNPIEMSNGVAYYMTSLKIPQNVLIYRFKDFFQWYAKLNDVDKEKYFEINNLTLYRAVNEIGSLSPGGGWPAVDYTFLNMYRTDNAIPEASMKYTAFKYEPNDDNSYNIETYMIPPGEYSFHLGFGKVNQMKVAVDVFLNGKLLRTILPSEINGFQYDRGGGGYPEFYLDDPNVVFTSDNLKYNMDGSRVDNVLIEGEEAQPIELTFRTTEGGTICFFHWCFRPTADCY